MREITFYPSKRKYKKYDAYDGDTYLCSFGDIRYQHYHDKLGYYSHLDHHDKQRRKRYYSRHNKDYPKYSADWFSKKILW